jgi:6-phospho-3-hexuloisomerase
VSGSSYRGLLEAVLAELRGELAGAEEGAIGALVDRITAARRVFVAGTGRSGLMVRAFAVRLVHLGYTTYVAGETVTPAIQPSDLLLVGSGSGETASLRAMAEKARSLGAPIALVTASPQSTIGRMCNLAVTLRAPTPKALRAEVASAASAQPATAQPASAQPASSVQPMGSLFEQGLLLLLDLVVLLLMERKQIGPEAMFARHANLE